MLDLIVAGCIARKAVARVDKNNKPFVLVKIRIPLPDKSFIATIIAFRQDLIEKLNKLNEGDFISVSGAANLYMSQFNDKDFVKIDITVSQIY